MDPNNFLTDDAPRRTGLYEKDSTGASPESARAAGAKVSGRVISATTQLSKVIVYDETDQEFRLRSRRGGNSLFTALECLQMRTEWECINVGWEGEIETSTGRLYDQKLGAEEKDHLEKMFCSESNFQIVPVWIHESAAKLREYAENTIWPMFHYIQSLDVRVLNSQSEDGYEFYRFYNERYAERILELYKPGDVIWIHDFYLLLLPQLLRKKLPDAMIGLYMHTSFPSSEFIRCIPQREQLLQGILGASVVGVQAQNYARHLLSSCIRILGNDHSGNNILVDGRIATICALHVGIDANHVIKVTDEPESRKLVEEIRKIHHGTKLIIGRDKLDNAQSVIQKLHAFSLFLEYYPEWRGKVTLIQITTPAFDQDFKSEKQIAEMVTDINGLYGDIQYTPIQHHTSYISQNEYFALMEVSGLGLFTSIRDSTCYAVLEYVVCQRRSRNPVLLSEFMGLSGLLSGAIPVNPFNPLEVAESIHKALCSPNSDKSDFEIAKEYSVDTWVKTFLSNIVTHDLLHESSHHTPALDIPLLVKCYKAAKKRLFLFDYDGTLTPIVKDPAAAVPSDRLKNILQKLSGDPNNEVWIISGRDQQFLDEHLGKYPVNLSAEHGCFVKYANKEWEDLAAQEDKTWQKICLEVMQSYTERTLGAVIEQKKQSITWHYRRADPVFGAFQAGHLRAYLENSLASAYPVDVMSGKANVEVRPKMYNKGEIVRSIFKQEEEKPQFVLCMGDDTTDEDMFRAVLDQGDRDHFFTVCIGPATKMTVASSHLTNPEKNYGALEALISS